MPRPRTSSKVLELRGSYVAKPSRRRADAEGSAPFDPAPPVHLPPECASAWRQIVERLPRVTLCSADELSVEVAAVLLQRVRATGDLRAMAELRHWLSALGFSPVARTRLVSPPPDEVDDFSEFTRPKR